MDNSFKQELQTHIKPEKSLYEPALDFVQGQFMSRHGLNSKNVVSTAEITAKGGARAGKFSCPDVTLITSRKYDYVPLRTLHIYSFEIKTEHGCNADAVLEAASHRQQTHFAYVVWHLPAASQRASRLDRVSQFASKFGVGLIVVRSLVPDHSRFAEVEFLVAPQEHTPNPELVDQYIEDRMSPAYKEKIKSWLRLDR